MAYLMSGQKLPPGICQAQDELRIETYTNAVSPGGRACRVRKPLKLEAEIPKGGMLRNQCRPGLETSAALAFSIALVASHFIINLLLKVYCLVKPN
jgi:hypothetical protein